MATTSRDPVAVKAKIDQALKAGDPRKAVSLGRTLIKLPRAGVEDCLAVVELCKRFMDNKGVLLAIRQAVRRAPEDAGLTVQQAELAYLAGHTREAFEILQRARERTNTAKTLQAVAELYGRMGEADVAFDIYAEAAKMDPDDLSIKENMAIGLAFMGRVEESEALYDAVIGTGSAKGLTYLNRSWLRKQTDQSNHVEELQARLAEVEQDRGAAPFLNYALAKEYEDLGRPDDAISYIEKAARQRKTILNYNVEPELQELDSIIETFDENFFRNQRGGYENNEPIFILGLPRSGSTLVERFVASHGAVFAAGELQNFKRMVRHATSAIAFEDGAFGNVDRVKLAPRLDFKALGRRYIESTRPRTGHTAHFIDKFPLNFVNVGLIAAALPQAKIIHTWRDPMDACFAMYKQSFLEGYYYTYDLDDLARYYLHYRKVMDHWDAVLPGRIIHVRYEDVVRDTEPVVRDLIARLGLDWQDACLDHTANPDASMTASATQVRQPVYASSVGKWRQFEAHLAPLRRRLEAGGIPID